MPPPASSRAAITTTARQGHVKLGNQNELITLEQDGALWWLWCGRDALRVCLFKRASSVQHIQLG